MSVYNAAKPSNESADAYLRFRPYLDNTHKKFGLLFFTNWLRGSPQKVVGLKKWDLRVALLLVVLG